MMLPDQQRRQKDPEELHSDFVHHWGHGFVLKSFLAGEFKHERQHGLFGRLSIQMDA